MPKRDKSIKIKVISVKALSVNINDYRIYGIKKDDIDNLSYETLLSINIDKEIDNLNIDVFVKVLHDKTNNVLVESKVRSSYFIMHMDKYFDENKKELKLPDELLNDLIETSVANTRGVMSMQLNSTDYQNITLPLTSAEEFQPMK